MLNPCALSSSQAVLFLTVRRYLELFAFFVSQFLESKGSSNIYLDWRNSFECVLSCEQKERKMDSLSNFSFLGDMVFWLVELCVVDASPVFVCLEVFSHLTYLVQHFLRLFRVHFMVRNLLFDLIDSF